MKVGVDSVLLGASCNSTNARRILDVGCGTGLLALMLAQKNPQAFVKAVEIDSEAAKEACRNAEASPWRVEVVCADFRMYASTTTEKFDLIISNPPYFENSLKNPEESKAVARHDKDLSYGELLSGVARLIEDNGHFYCILPVLSVSKFVNLAAEEKLYPASFLYVCTKEGKSPKRCIMSFTKRQNVPIENTIAVMSADSSSYTSEYIALTEDYYLFTANK